MNMANRVAVVTGAGSGIGRALAHALAQRGCQLFLVDINPRGLNQTLEQVRRYDVRVAGQPLDVADAAAVRALPAAVLTAYGRVDLLINNAGIASGGTFEQLSETDFDRIIDVNFRAVVQLTRHFLPHLHQRDDARLVYLSSLYGLIAPPEQTAYSASKFAVRGFANALRHELARSTVGVTVVHPGGVATNIARHARIPKGAPETEIRQKLAAHEKMLRMAPEQAAEIIVNGIERNKARILVGNDARFVAWLERLLPVSYWTVLRKLV